MVEEVFNDRSKQFGVAAGKRAARDKINYFAQANVLRVVIARAITARFQLCDLLCSQTEEEKVLGADFLANLDICAVERADCKRTVKSKLHITGSARLLARGGNLFGQISGRINKVSGRYVEAGEINHLSTVAHRVIVVHDFADSVDEFDNAFGHEITWRCFSSEDEGARRYIR